MRSYAPPTNTNPDAIGRSTSPDNRTDFKLPSCARRSRVFFTPQRRIVRDVASAAGATTAVMDRAGDAEIILLMTNASGPPLRRYRRPQRCRAWRRGKKKKIIILRARAVCHRRHRRGGNRQIIISYNHRSTARRPGVRLCTRCDTISVSWHGVRVWQTFRVFLRERVRAVAKRELRRRRIRSRTFTGYIFFFPRSRLAVTFFETAARQSGRKKYCWTRQPVGRSYYFSVY